MRINITSLGAAHEIASHIAIGDKTEFIEIALSRDESAPIARLRGGQLYNELRFVAPDGRQPTNATVTIEAPDPEADSVGGVSHTSSSSCSRSPEDARLTAALLNLAADVSEQLRSWAAGR